MASDGSSAAINGDDLRTGDHVYTWRTEKYGHHGIYVGNGMIIEFTTGDALKTISSSVVSKGSGAVGMCNWKDFRGRGSLYRYEYGVSEDEFKNKRAGTCTTARADAPDTVKHRAKYLLSHGYGRYNLLTHNCEDFALYCKTGLVVSGLRCGSSQAALANIFNIFGCAASCKCISGSGEFDPEYRYLMDIGVRSDTVRTEVEDLVKSQGGDNNLGENTETRIMGMAYQREDNNLDDDNKMETRITGIEERLKELKSKDDNKMATRITGIEETLEELKSKGNVNILIIIIIIMTILTTILATMLFSQGAFPKQSSP